MPGAKSQRCPTCHWRSRPGSRRGRATATGEFQWRVAGSWEDNHREADQFPLFVETRHSCVMKATFGEDERTAALARAVAHSGFLRSAADRWPEVAATFI